MKKLLLLALIIGLIGCGNNKLTKLIESFVCTTDGVTSDLSFKMIELEEISTITATDSIVYLLWSESIPLKYVWNGDSLSFSYQDEDGTLENETISIARIDSNLISFGVSSPQLAA